MKRPAPHLALIVLLSLTGGWAPKRAPLMTRWAADVRPDAVLPEYPRPQMVRPDWLNLNGVWEYQPGAANDAVPGGKLSGEILVPFPVESALSGVMEHHDRLWYRRSFTVPPAWRGRRVMLHFGAVDFEAEAFVNGHSVGSHRGGYDPFTFDVTDALAGGDGPQQLTVRVFDPTNAGGQPRGKQSLRPGGIMYTSVTGIWQTVWLEPVAAGGVEHLSVRPNVEGSSVRVAAVGAAADADVTVTVRDGERVVGTGHGRGADAVVVGVPDAKLWSPDRPFLYDVRVVVSRGEQTVDAVDGYFGMRSFGVGTVDGVRRLLLNGKPVFEFGPLDQGFWPDGIYTAPTEAALKSDLQAIKDLGFNMVRKHIKVEPARWYYWADRLGLLVWQDMPSADSYPGREPVPPVDRAEYERELTRVVETLRDVPSVAMWVVFNEGQGQFDTGRLVDLVRRLDPTRPVNEASGGNFTGAGDLTDIHAYPPPSCPPADPKRVLACGEFGGIGFEVPGHAWVTRGHSYTMIAAPADLVDQYAEFADSLKVMRDEHGLSAAVYTELTDVENEVNGLLTYDRVPKADVAVLARATRFELPPPVYTAVVTTSERQPQAWRYTTDRPGPRWVRADFNDAKWQQGPGGFGTAGAPSAGPVGTPWDGVDVWLRRTVDLNTLTPDQIKRLCVRAYHDGGVQVYVNGVEAFQYHKGQAGYAYHPMSDEARAAVKVGGPNVIAVHCRGRGEGRGTSVNGLYVDVGLSVREAVKVN